MQLDSSVPVSGGVSNTATQKDHTELLVQAFDLALMHSASRWDLDSRQGRKASAAWLRGTYEQLLLALKPDVFWELGANDAEFSRRLRAAMPRTTFHAFEANPYPYDKFRDLVTSAGVNYHQMAVGPEDGNAIFKVNRRLGDRDLPPEMGCNSILTKSGDRTYEEVTVKMITLDNFSAQEGLAGKTSAVWVDAEGFAFQVLQGMRETLKHSSFVFVEVEDRQLWEGQKTAGDVKRFLFEHGFIPILRDFEFKQQYNVLFTQSAIYENAAVRLALTVALQGSGSGAANSS